MLLTANVNGIPSDECKRKYKIPLSEKYQFCAGGANGEGACAGDSGGPIMEFVQDGQLQYHYIAGVVQGGFRCTEFTVYTRVDAYMNWIRDNLK